MGSSEGKRRRVRVLFSVCLSVCVCLCVCVRVRPALLLLVRLTALVDSFTDCLTHFLWFWRTPTNIILPYLRSYSLIHSLADSLHTADTHARGDTSIHHSSTAGRKRHRPSD
mmetsp:Transcript_145/g.384  ORF Transcript_145/g.384 Transcript_145/m.384 type:complete len:112 (-) Transcript_145:1923-2258(-)